MDMVENMGGIELNGRMDGDGGGELCFYGGRGNSLIDCYLLALFPND